MLILLKKMIRDLNKSKGQFISILIIVILGVALYTGMNATFKNLSDVSEKYYSEYRMGDLWIEFYKTPESVIQKIEKLPYVKMATERIVKEAKLSSPGENVTARLITLPDVKRDIVNDLIINSGQYFSQVDDNQCLVEEEFFKAHGLKLGDTITPIVNGNEVKLIVVGTVKSPEYVYILKDNGQMIPDNSRFGIIYIKKSFGQSIFDFNGSINNVSLLLKNGVDVDDAKENIKKELENYGVTSVIARENQLSYSMLDQEIEALKSVGGLFPIIFFVIAAVIIYIMMSRIIENQRTQIGVMKALGYGNTQVLFHYLGFSLFIGIIGSAIGAVVGMYLGVAYTELMNMNFHLPSTDVKLYPELVIPASILTLFFCLFAGYRSCKLVFRIMPSEAMKQKAPKTGKSVFIEEIEFIWKRLSHSWKIILRNIFRNLKRTLMISIGIIFSSAILFITIGMIESFQFMMSEQYQSINNYDIKASFSRFLNEEEISIIKNIPHIADVEPMVETGMEISNGWIKKDIGFKALINNPTMYKVTDDDGNSVNLTDTGIFVPEKLATQINAKVGDRVYLKSIYPGKEKKEVTIKGFIAQYMGLSAYGSMNSMNYLLGEGMVANTVVIKLDSASSEQLVKEKLNEIPVINSVLTKEDEYKTLQNQLATSMAFMYILIVLAAIMAVAVVYNITTINIFERQRELATLKVLGLYSNEVKKLIFNENYLITIFGIIVGLPVGYGMGSIVMQMFDSDAFTIPFITSSKTYIFATVLTLLFTFLANNFQSRKIKSINMVEVLKSNE